MNKDVINNQITGAGGAKSATDIVKYALSAVFGVVAVLSLIAIIYGGISYTTSQGDPGKIKKGKDAILYGIIGLVISLSAFAIVNFVLSNI